MFGWHFGIGTPEDKECGLFSVWFDNWRGFAVRIHFLVRPECWGFGVAHELNRFWTISIGPLMMIHLGDV